MSKRMIIQLAILNIIGGIWACFYSFTSTPFPRWLWFIATIASLINCVMYVWMYDMIRKRKG